MTDLLYEWFGIAVEALIWGMFIFVLLDVLNITQSANVKMSQQQGIQMELREYRKYNQYNGTDIHAQDVASAIMEFRGEPVVVVSYVNGSGNYAEVSWKFNSAANMYNTSTIDSYLKYNKMYSSSIIKGDNGEIVALKFVEVR